MTDRIADLHAELAFPSASRVQAVLRKEGVAVSVSQIKDVLSKKQGLAKSCNHRHIR